MYRNPGFITPIISPTTSGGIFYPTPGVDPVTNQPIACAPIVVHPPMHEGTTSPSPGPSRVRVRAYSPGLLELPPMVCGYICAVHHRGALSRMRPIYGGQEVDIDGPAAVVIEKIETPNFAIGFELLGFSEQPATGA
jgi:hypothetical protein